MRYQAAPRPVFARQSIGRRLDAAAEHLSDPPGSLSPDEGDGEGQWNDATGKRCRPARSRRSTALLARRPASAGIARERSRHARLLRDRAVALGIDLTHFRGQRSWSDAQLISAVPAANDWTELMQTLGYPADSGSARNTIRGHCARIGISPSHLDVSAGDDRTLPRPPPAASRLRSAGPMLVAGYLTLEGYRVSWPLEPAPYDLLVSQAKETPSRVQVKTSTRRDMAAPGYVRSRDTPTYLRSDGTYDRSTTSWRSMRSLSSTGISRST